MLVARAERARRRPQCRAGARSPRSCTASPAATVHVRQALAGVLRLKLAHRIAPVRHIASSLVLLGLIGTIIGFVIALSGVNQDAVTDPAAIGPMVATLLHGMAMALFKTLVGSVLNVWLMVDYRLLEGGAVHLLTRSDRGGRAPCSRLTTTAGDDSDIVFRDLILLMLTGFVTVAVLMLAHINPKAAAATAKDDASAPGNVMVEANWPPGHGQRRRSVGAGAGRPAGRLLQQGRGRVQPAARRSRPAARRLRPQLREQLCSRGIVPGEYTVNLHLYRNRAADVGRAGDRDRQQQARRRRRRRGRS